MFGISEFAGDPGLAEIRCIFKRLYSDFVVVELPAKGHIRRPTSIVSEREEEEHDEKKEETRRIAERPERLTGQEYELIRSVADGKDEQCAIDLKDWSKDERKCLHQFIRTEFGLAQIQSSCENGRLTIKRRTDNNASVAAKRSHWPKGRGDFLHFTMAKRNMDSSGAIHLMARSARLKPSMFSISGTKDRRAITVQRVSAYRVERHKLAEATRNLRGIWLSDFNYQSAPLKLGDALGNSFSVILRDIDISAVEETGLGGRVDQWSNLGFLNYFGPQRFGSCGVDTAQIGRLILGGQWEEATRALLAPRQDAKDALNKCLEQYASEGNATEALKQIESLKASATTIERTILATLSKSPNAHKAAILALHRDMRTMYLHAYQSLVFNKIVSKRRAKFGLDVLAGDLDSNGNVLTEGCGSIEQVFLPLPSSADTKLPQNEVGQWYKEIAEEDGIQCDHFAKLEKQFSVGSIYRPYLVRPSNVKWEMIDYSSDMEQLQQCEFIPEEKQQQHEMEQKIKKLKGLKIHFDLPSGAYATMALRELMRTDFSKAAQKMFEEEIGNRGRPCH